MSNRKKQYWWKATSKNIIESHNIERGIIFVGIIFQNNVFKFDPTQCVAGAGDTVNPRPHTYSAKFNYTSGLATALFSTSHKS